MAWQTHHARERDEAVRLQLRIERLEAAIAKIGPPKQDELIAELERLRREAHIPPTV
jgi:BMFP domain-containing protein YqiC